MNSLLHLPEHESFLRPLPRDITLREIARRTQKAQSVNLELQGGSDLNCLTPSERRVAELVGQGCNTPRIAEMLGLVVGTVKGKVHKIYQKLNIDSRAQLALLITGRAETSAERGAIPVGVPCPHCAGLGIVTEEPEGGYSERKWRCLDCKQVRTWGTSSEKRAREIWLLRCVDCQCATRHGVVGVIGRTL